MSCITSNTTTIRRAVNLLQQGNADDAIQLLAPHDAAKAQQIRDVYTRFLAENQTVVTLTNEIQNVLNDRVSIPGPGNQILLNDETSIAENPQETSNALCYSNCPFEILLKIFGKLDARMILSCKLVNSIWDDCATHLFLEIEIPAQKAFQQTFIKLISPNDCKEIGGNMLIVCNQDIKIQNFYDLKCRVEVIEALFANTLILLSLLPTNIFATPKRMSEKLYDADKAFQGNNSSLLFRNFIYRLAVTQELKELASSSMGKDLKKIRCFCIAGDTAKRKLFKFSIEIANKHVADDFRDAAFRNIAIELIKHGDYKQAELIIDQIPYFVDKDKAVENLILALILEGDLETAVEKFEKYTTNNNILFAASSFLGFALMANKALTKGDLKKAEELENRIIHLLPKPDEKYLYYFSRLFALIQKGDLDKADEYVRTRMNSDLSLLYIPALIQVGEGKRAIALLKSRKLTDFCESLVNRLEQKK